MGSDTTQLRMLANRGGQKHSTEQNWKNWSNALLTFIETFSEYLNDSQPPLLSFCCSADKFPSLFIFELQC